MSDLLTLREAGAVLRCRDPRTAKSRLAKLGVAVLNLDGYLLVERHALERAIRAHARPLTPVVDTDVRTGVRLSRDADVWDSPSATSSGPTARQRRRAEQPGDMSSGPRPKPTQASAVASSSSRTPEEDR
jgi:hypothetical protein